MSFKQILQDDLDVFYNSDEFGVPAVFNAKEIVISFLEDEEISGSEQTIISAKSSDVVGVDVGSIISIDGIEYKVTNFDDKDSTKLEQLIAIIEV